MYYLYILYSAEADKYYIGHSHDPWQRLEQHLSNSGEKYTGSYRDWKLVAVFDISSSKGDADKIEKLIKRQKSRTLIEKVLSLGLLEQGCWLSWFESRTCGINHGVSRMSRDWGAQ